MDAGLMVETLLGEISLAEAQIDEKKKIISFIRNWLDANQASAAPTTGVRAFEAPLPPPKLPPLVLPPRKTLRSMVAEEVSRLAGFEFTAAEIHEHLAKRGVLLPEDPRSKIATVLSRMTEAGEIYRTYTGTGSVPNKYREAEKGADLQAEDEPSDE